MSQVLLHNLTIKGIENVPGILDYDQRALIFANPGDLVITRKKIDGDYVKYLESLGYDFTDVYFYESKWKDQTYDSIFEEPALKEAIKPRKNQPLHTFQVTEIENTFAKNNDLIFLTDYKVAEKYGRKSPFRKLCKSLNIPIAQGYESLKSVKEVIEAIYSINSKTVLLRLDEGISGAGNFLIKKSEFIELNSNSQIESVKEILSKIPQRMKDSFVTVEEWMDKVSSSPSLQIEISKNGNIKILSTHEQILQGEEKWFVGSKYPAHIDSKVFNKIKIDAKKIAKQLHSEGFVGEFGLDLIIEEDCYYFVEANVRITGTSYPREFVKKVCTGLENIYYQAGDVNLKKFENITFKDIFNLLRSVLFEKTTKSGLLIYNTGVLETSGRFDIISVGQNKYDVENIMLKTRDILSKEF